MRPCQAYRLLRSKAKIPYFVGHRGIAHLLLWPVLLSQLLDLYLHLYQQKSVSILPCRRVSARCNYERHKYLHRGFVVQIYLEWRRAPDRQTATEGACRRWSARFRQPCLHRPVPSLPTPTAQHPAEAQEAHGERASDIHPPIQRRLVVISALHVPSQSHLTDTALQLTTGTCPRASACLALASPILSPVSSLLPPKVPEFRSSSPRTELTPTPNHRPPPRRPRPREGAKPKKGWDFWASPDLRLCRLPVYL